MTTDGGKGKGRRVLGQALEAARARMMAAQQQERAGAEGMEGAGEGQQQGMAKVVAELVSRRIRYEYVCVQSSHNRPRLI